MTSEVVVMNNLAVALAADSAATVSASGPDNKIYNSADKLFMLSKRHPVGVMVYSNGTLLGIPWETILKMFRRRLGDDEYPTLEEYGLELIKYLDNNTKLFPEALQHQYLLEAIEDLYQSLVKASTERFVGALKVPTEEQSEAIKIAKEVILEKLEQWKARPDSKTLTRAIAEKLVGRLSGKISELTVRVFDGFAPDSEASKALYELAIMIVSKDAILADTFSGVVVAGFGREEHMPVMQEFGVGGVYENRLKHMTPKVQGITATTPSIIRPFAQSQMVNTFLYGINPDYEKTVLRETLEFIRGLPAAVLDRIPELSPDQKGAFASTIRPEILLAAKQMFVKLREARDEAYWQPAHQAIANLSKGDLAHVASSLVNLNLFQKRMSTELETVGGPIDVAVISKGDGFIWIDRKHYFKPSLNQHFFQNYYPDYRRRGEDDEKA